LTEITVASIDLMTPSRSRMMSEPNQDHLATTGPGGRFDEVT